VVYDGDDDEEIYEYVEVVGVNAKKIMWIITRSNREIWNHTATNRS
jgi:hypothetical protein